MIILRRNWSMEQFTICMMITYLHQTQQHQVLSNLYDSSFYFMTSDYRVYKVLDNNDGEHTLVFESTSTSTSSFELGGYILKYMYQVTSSDSAKFLTSDFIPVSNDSTVSVHGLTDGKIESLKITDRKWLHKWNLL